MPRALVVDDDPNTLTALRELVALEGFDVASADSLQNARYEILKKPPDVVVCDLFLPDGQGTELLEEVRDKHRGVEVIVTTGNASVESAVNALRLGAYDYMTKPIDVPRLRSLLAGVTRTRELKKQVSSLRGELRQLGRFGPMVGTSSSMQEVYDLIERVAPMSTTVFVVGESGTGKELAAQAVHQLSRRAMEPFLPVNCGAISANLIESELFGHEKGSFTGANRRHHGYFERASGGTLFLDEITEMPIELQVKLLRVLESGQVQRVGGSELLPVDVRVVAATNRDPEEAVEEKKLREDLYYRLRVFPIQLPPLRERDEDLELLARHFVQQLNRRQGTVKQISDEAIASLGQHRWPGNVRELKNVLERAFILADDRISAESLPAELRGVSGVRGPFVSVRVGSTVAAAEKRLILATLDQLDQDKKAAAKTLGISLKTLYNRLNSYDDEASET